MYFRRFVTHVSPLGKRLPLFFRFVQSLVLGTIFLHMILPAYMLALFRCYLPLKKGVALNLIKLEFSLPKDVPNWVEFGPVVVVKNIFKNFINVIKLSLIVNSLSSPLVGVRGPLFEQMWISLTQGCFVPSFVEIGPGVLEKKSKIGKILQTFGLMDGQTERWQTTGDQKSSLEL